MIARSIAAALAAGGTTALFVSVSVPSAAASATGTVAIAEWDAATDTTPQVVNGETSPRGTFRFFQEEDAANLNDVTVKGSVTGLRPFSSYVTVLYVDGVCAPTPSVTAFPSAVFTTDETGSATLNKLPLNPQAINALRTFDIEDTLSVSIRDVVMPGQTLDGSPVTVPTLPNGGETEACDKDPYVK